jgi:hypothetical protein
MTALASASASKRIKSEAGVGFPVFQPAAKASPPSAKKINQVVQTILSYAESAQHTEVANFFNIVWKPRVSKDLFWAHLGTITKAFKKSPSPTQASDPTTWKPAILELGFPIKSAVPMLVGSHPQLAVWTTTDFGLITEEGTFIRAKTNDPDYFCVSPDGWWAAEGWRYGKLCVRNLTTGKTEEIEESRPPQNAFITLEHIQFAFDGTLLAAYAADQKGIVCQWDPQTRTQKQKFKVPGYHIESFAFSPSGKRAFVQVTEMIPPKEQTAKGNPFTTSLLEYDFKSKTFKRIALPGPPHGMIWKGGLAVVEENTLVAVIRQGDKPSQLWAIDADTQKSALLPAPPKLVPAPPKLADSRQNNDPTKLWTIDPDTQNLIPIPGPSRDEITQLQAGMNGLFYAITDTGQFLVYDATARTLLKSQVETDLFRNLQLQSCSTSVVALSRLKEGHVTLMFNYVPPVAQATASASASTATAAAPAVGQKRKKEF